MITVGQIPKDFKWKEEEKEEKFIRKCLDESFEILLTQEMKKLKENEDDKS